MDTKGLLTHADTLSKGNAEDKQVAVTEEQKEKIGQILSIFAGNVVQGSFKEADQTLEMFAEMLAENESESQVELANEFVSQCNEKEIINKVMEGLKSNTGLSGDKLMTMAWGMSKMGKFPKRILNCINALKKDEGQADELLKTLIPTERKTKKSIFSKTSKS